MTTNDRVSDHRDAVRSLSEIDSDLVLVRHSLNDLKLEPPSADRVRNKQALEDRERELVREREVSVEDHAARQLTDLADRRQDAEAALEEARHASDKVAREYQELAAALLAKQYACERAIAERNAREAQLAGIERQIDAIHRAQTSTPAAVKAAAEAGLERIQVVLDGRARDMATASPYRLMSFAVTRSSEPALQAIIRYLRSVPRAVGREFEERVEQKLRQQTIEARRQEDAAELKARADEREILARAEAEREARRGGNDDE